MPPLHIGLDQAHLLKLDADAASVIVANPAHASVIVDTPRHLVVVPRRAGATEMQVLNAAGEEIMRRHLIIGAAQPQYLKIRRACGLTAAGEACEAMSYYYCPDGCHEIALGADQEATGGAGNTATGGGTPTAVAASAPPAGSLTPTQARE